MKIVKFIAFFILCFIPFLNFAKIIFDYTWIVVKIDDWDTFRIQHNWVVSKIRVLWIDTPELIHPWLGIKSYKFYWCWKQASEFAIKLLSWKVVYVYKDSLAKNKDKYYRFLRYVFITVNYKWKRIKLPYGMLAIYKWRAKVYKRENFTLKQLYYKIEKIAKTKHIWIWSSKCINEDKLIKQQYLNKYNFPSVKYNNWNSYFRRYNNFNIKNNLKDEKNLADKKEVCWYTYHKIWCDIKWNINKYGEKIYHLPWRKYYKYTKIDPSKWERRFCTQEQAIKCWRRPSKIR